MAAEGMQFPWRWNGGTISPKWGVIGEMSVQQPPGIPAHGCGVRFGEPGPCRATASVRIMAGMRTWLLVALLLAGCASAMVKPKMVKPEMVKPEMPEQTLDAVKTDYDTAVQIAVAYKRGCESKAPELKLGCDKHVAEIQRIHRDIVFPALAKVEAALQSGFSPHLTVSIDALQAAVGELTLYMSRNTIGNIFRMDQTNTA